MFCIKSLCGCDLLKRTSVEVFLYKIVKNIKKRNACFFCIAEILPLEKERSAIMKTIRFFITACLLVTMLTFTGCGNQKDTNNDAIPDDQQNNTVQQDADDAADDVREDADDLGDDIKDGVDDAADDVKDVLDGDDNKHNDNNKTDQTDKNQNDVKQ